MIPRAKLGRTDMQVTRLGYGSMGLRGPRTWGVRVVSDQDSHRMLNAVLDAGINFIDTAPDYGIAEERIGAAISDRRDEYYLATKCGCVYTQHDDHLEIDHLWNADVIRDNLHTSLRRLQSDYVDLLQFHGGDAETLQQAGLIDLLQQFRDQGLVRWIGVSSKLPNLSGLLELDVFDTYQIPYSCLAPEHHDAISAAARRGAGTIIRGGIAHGGPDAEIERPQLNEVWSAARLDELLDEGMTKAELILRYTLTHPDCHTTIVGTCNHDHLAANIAATERGPLADDLYQQVTDRVAEAIK